MNRKSERLEGKPSPDYTEPLSSESSGSSSERLTEGSESDGRHTTTSRLASPGNMSEGADASVPESTTPRQMQIFFLKDNTMVDSLGHTVYKRGAKYMARSPNGEIEHIAPCLGFPTMCDSFTWTTTTSSKSNRGGKL